ncbi:hypothetical protein [Paraburkholderia sp. SIMBA_054]|uniref:hypothetical protein n=1 Tax=Paraburkholderia sp. SIMBA_054 TaxID=3085795 RepID=UPI0039784D47
MSDINASIQPQDIAQQGVETPAALNVDAGAPVGGVAPVVGGDLPNAGTDASANAGSSSAAIPSSAPLIDSVAIVTASGTQATGAEGGDAHAQFVAAMTPAYVSLGAQAASLDQGASHAAHGFADQIADHVTALEGSADSFLAKMASEVKKLVAQIKSVL